MFTGRDLVKKSLYYWNSKEIGSALKYDVFLKVKNMLKRAEEGTGNIIWTFK